MKMKKWRNNSTPSGLFGTNTTLFSSITLEDCALDPELNILQSPECECGCGGKCSICLKDDDEVFNFCTTMVFEDDCEYCAVFAINEENKLLGVVKCADGINRFKSTNTIIDYTDIGKIFDEMELYCYGLIVWNGDGLYRIVEE